MKPINILIIDDQRTIRVLLADILKQMGYKNVDLASTSEEGFKIIQNKLKRGEEIDLILLDINLPDNNGVEICEELKKKSEFKDVPIVMITGNEDSATLKKAFAVGASDYITKNVSEIEIKARISSALNLRKEIKKRNAREEELKKTARKLKAANKKLEEMASQDGLTNLANRRLFDKIIKKEWQQAQKRNNCLGLIMLDIDYFKRYNDYYGHQTGDDCLKELAAVMKEVISPEKDLVARYGGEEFAIILPESNLRKIEAVTKKLQAKIDNLKIEHPDSPIANYVTVSIGGVVTRPQRNESFEQLIEKTDDLLYKAKKNGRNQIKIEEV